MTSIAFARFRGHRRLVLYALLLLLSCLGLHSWLQSSGLAMKYQLKPKDGASLPETYAFSSDYKAKTHEVASLVAEVQRLGNPGKSSKGVIQRKRLPLLGLMHHAE